jgi:hypothetical protein
MIAVVVGPATSDSCIDLRTDVRSTDEFDLDLRLRTDVSIDSQPRGDLTITANSCRCSIMRSWCRPCP